MSFRKRNVVISQAGAPTNSPAPKTTSLPGVRPSSVSGIQITSTGTASLDKLLAVGGVALGSSLFIEEEGTTDFSSSLLRCFAAEGVLQGHAVFVVAPEGSMGLPGLVEEKKDGRGKSGDEEKMKIAWRYERLGAFQEERDRGLPQRQPGPTNDSDSPVAETKPFCHAFDLTKRLSIPATSIPLTYLCPSQSSTETSPFQPILAKLSAYLSSNPSTPTRLVLPSLLSPLFYPPTSSQPHYLLSFIHAIRGLLRAKTSLIIMISYPLALYPRHLPLTRWIESLLDGVLVLQPFPHAYSIDSESTPSTNSSTTKDDEKMQGLLKVLKAPILSERGVGVGGLGMSAGGEDMAFAVGRKRFIIRPFHLPPVEGEEETTATTEEKKKAKDLEF